LSVQQHAKAINKGNFAVKTWFLIHNFSPKHRSTMNRKAVLIAFLLPLSIVAFGQRSKKNSQKTVQFGVSLGVDYGRFELTDWEENGLDAELGSVEVAKGTGFSLGIQSQARLSEVWSVRLQPTLAFSGKLMSYNFQNNTVKQYEHQLMSLDLPLDMQYRFFAKRISPVIIFGGWWRSNLQADRIPEIILAKSEGGINLGFGLDFQKKKFTIRPEFLMSVGLKNSLSKEAVFKDAKALDGIYRDRISLRLNFIG
jgi:hypothetical protein